MHLPRRLSLLVSAVLTIGVLPAVIHHAADAAPSDAPFTALRDFHPTGDRIRVEPRSYAASRVDVDALRAVLAPATTTQPVTLAIPGPDGQAVRFRVERTSLMQSKLAAAHPEIVTFAGRGVDDPAATIALDMTPMGFHASVRAAGGQAAWYVDPAYNQRGTTEHLSYYGAALPVAEQRQAEGEVRAIRSTVEATLGAQPQLAGDLVQRRFFRLALTSDPSYATYFGTANVLAEKVTLINRVNQVYNDDMAINLRLVNATDMLNLDTAAKATGANGPCGAAACFTVGQLAGCDLPTLGRNRTVLGQLVGASNYDIGHLALGVNGGGIAYIGVTGGDYKGGGCTGLPDPRGDFFAIDYVAHEMGHQFGGNHTFNGALGACGGNISEASVEPGSGSSVMAYAGICGQDDLQPHTDPYFSHLTIGEVTTLAESVPYRNIEAQTVSLRGFDTNGEQITLGFGAQPPITLTRGTDYTAAGIDAAVATLTGMDVAIAQWGFDEVVESPGAPSDAGFQVIFNDTPTVFEADDTDIDIASLTVSSPSAGVSGFVGETARGGLSSNGGSTVETTHNNSPVVAAPADKTLPLRTPFALTASATDANGDSLTYLWEQADFGDEDGTRLAENAKTTGPLFRVFGTAAEVSDPGSLEIPSPGENTADGSPTRVFPDMAQVLAGNTNAATGACAAPPNDTVALTSAQRDCFSEFLPVPGYLGSVGSSTPAMHFRVTARDGYLNGGGSSYDDVVLTIDPTKGPFLVTSQAAPGGSTRAGIPLTVTWKANGTETLAPTVKVTMSTNGGATFDQVLAASTPNDGSEALVLPNVPTTHARIKIEALGNYFFDTNDAEFKVLPADTVAPNTSITSGPKQNSVVLSKTVHLAYKSSEAGSTFACSVDGLATPCGTVAVTLMGLKAGTHTFSVAARDGAGNTDASPASRTFTVPVDDPKLKHKNDWQIRKAASAFGGEYSRSSSKGDKLTFPARDVTRIVLVVGTGKNLGPVKVYLDKLLLKTIRLFGKRHGMVLRTAAAFDHPRSGKLKIVVGKDKPVRIEGVALVDG